MKTAAFATVFALLATAAAAQDQPRTHRIDWPSVVALAGGQVLDLHTTHSFLGGAGESRSNPGHPCVEANPAFPAGPHQWRDMVVQKMGLVVASTVLNYVAENWHPGVTKHRTAEQAALAAKSVRVVSRGVNWFGAAWGFKAGLHNIAHCGVL